MAVRVTPSRSAVSELLRPARVRGWPPHQEIRAEALMSRRQTASLTGLSFTFTHVQAAASECVGTGCCPPRVLRN